MSAQTSQPPLSEHRYPARAYDFVRDGLAFTVKRLHGDLQADALAEPRHVAGRDLCLGLRDFALERYGKLARTVVESWGIRGTSDFGQMVFDLINMQVLAKTADDRPEDFHNVYDFADAFPDGSPPFQPAQ
jgi:uncharacterized repeat protein (TIGR04138 family)